MSDLADRAEQAREALAKNASTVDRDGVLPLESLVALRRSGLMGLLVPAAQGGLGGGPAELVAVARHLAGACLSSALLWAMHCQQVAILVRHASGPLRDAALPAIAAGDCYLGSVTTERRRGADLGDVEAPAQWTGDRVRIRRSAPVVSGGQAADAFLITMRRHEHSDRSNVILVFARRDQLSVRQTGQWDAMGMRGTGSVPLELDGVVPAGQVIDPPEGFTEVARATMVPFGHLAWAACWLGAAEGALREVVAFLRDPATRRQMGTIDDYFQVRLGRVRGHLEVADAVLEKYTRQLGAWPRGVPEDLPEIRFRVLTNNVKVLVADAAFAAVEQLVPLVGMRLGYTRTSPVPLERVYRDLRSAALMFPNDRLLAINGKLVLVEPSDPLAALPEPRA